jgi:hypothetical protein
MTEHQTQNLILRYLSACDRLRVWRQNTGVARFKDRTVRFGVPGQADISGLVFPSGRRLEIEVKTKTGRQSDAQRNYAEMIRQMGGLYILARCVEDVYTALRNNFPDTYWPTLSEAGL